MNDVHTVLLVLLSVVIVEELELICVVSGVFKTRTYQYATHNTLKSVPTHSR